MNHPDTESIFGPFNDLAFANLEVRPELLTRSTDALLVDVDDLTFGNEHTTRTVLAVWSLEAFAQADRGVTWHDDEEHCPTWAIGCRCDLGRES